MLTYCNALPSLICLRVLKRKKNKSQALGAHSGAPDKRVEKPSKAKTAGHWPPTTSNPKALSRGGSAALQHAPKRWVAGPAHTACISSRAAWHGAGWTDALLHSLSSRGDLVSVFGSFVTKGVGAAWLRQLDTGGAEVNGPLPHLIQELKAPL